MIYGTTVPGDPIVCYVVGPYTASDFGAREVNIAKAKQVGFRLAQQGLMPLIPHANTAHFDEAQDANFWYRGTMRLLQMSDCAVIMQGHEYSTGSSGEKDAIEMMGMPHRYLAASSTLYFKEIAECLRQIVEEHRKGLKWKAWAMGDA